MASPLTSWSNESSSAPKIIFPFSSPLPTMYNSENRKATLLTRRPNQSRQLRESISLPVRVPQGKNMADEKSEKNKAIDLALAQIDKQFGKGSIIGVGRKATRVPYT